MNRRTIASFSILLLLVVSCAGEPGGSSPAGISGPGTPFEQIMAQLENGVDERFCRSLCADSDTCRVHCQGHYPCRELCGMVCDQICKPLLGGLTDGGARADAGVAPDQGFYPDQRIEPDAGVSPDQGVAPDQRITPDQGVSPDQALPPPTSGKTYYVRPGGGDASQCTGLSNIDYPGSGTGQACAWKHPFVALPPGGSPRIKGGDTLFIAKGTYRMGYPVAGASCSSSWPWDCYMAPIPSGPSASQPTRILGEGWSSGCAAPPTLYGAERTKRVINLVGSSNVELQCLDLTDHSGCVSHHSGGLACDRSGYPDGDYASTGLRAEDSKNVRIKKVKIHGFAVNGVKAARLTDWTLEDVDIVGNGWAGWDGDLGSSSSSNSGTILFRRVNISWNGCGESYPGLKPAGCWGQTAGGYGDGLGTHATGGDWVFEDCRVLHNTSDGLDLLYHTRGGTITVRRLHAEGNAGQQLKVTGDAHVENSLLVGNCAYFAGKSFTHNVDHCRAMGNTVSVSLVSGADATLVNNTIYGEGDVLIQYGASGSSSCNGSESFILQNNIMHGDTEYHSPSDKSAWSWTSGSCSGLSLASDYNIIHNVKNGCPGSRGPHDLCQDPQLGPLSGDAYGMMPPRSSPAVDSGKAVGGIVPAHDIYKVARPQGAGVDRGACEVQ